MGRPLQQFALTASLLAAGCLPSSDGAGSGGDVVQEALRDTVAEADDVDVQAPIDAGEAVETCEGAAITPCDCAPGATATVTCAQGALTCACDTDAGLGAPCETGQACDSGLCVALPYGEARCSAQCAEPADCPAGWECLPRGPACADCGFLCVPVAPWTCVPCDPEGACPAGLSCQDERCVPHRCLGCPECEGCPAPLEPCLRRPTPLDGAAAPSEGACATGQARCSCPTGVAQGACDAGALRCLCHECLTHVDCGANQACRSDAEGVRRCRDEDFAPCQGPADCAFDLCFEVPATGAQRCTEPCIDTCPEGWGCALYDHPIDLVFLCAPYAVGLCRPCEADADCVTGVIPPGRCLDSGVCAASCAQGPCPDAFVCEGEGDDRWCLPATPGACATP